MIVRVKLFAAARSLLGADEVEVETSAGATAADLKQALAAAAPEFAQLASVSRIAVNARYVADDEAIDAGGEVACIPPVSGG